MASIAIGDIHGHLDELNGVLALLTDVLTPDDTLVFLGDVIDRGPRTRECVERILEFQASTPAACVGLIGNHEDWMLRTLGDPSRHDWLLGMEGLDTIESYSREAAAEILVAAQKAGPALYLGGATLPYDAFFDRVPPAHMTFFTTLKPCYQTKDAVFVHGGIDPRASIMDQPAQAMIWGTEHFQSRYDSEDWLVYGHWNNARRGKNGKVEPMVIKRTIGIDTIWHGVLTALRLPDLSVFQSNQTAPWTLDI